MSKLALELIAKEKKARTRKLDLGRCGLKELPDELFELVWLEELILGDERFILGKEKGIKNEIVFIPNKISKLTELKALDISNNMIRDVTPLGKLKKLSYLILGNNAIEDISMLENGECFCILNNNKIKNVSKTFLVQQVRNFKRKTLDEIRYLKDLLVKNQYYLVAASVRDLESSFLRIKENKGNKGNILAEHERISTLIINICFGENPIESPPADIFFKSYEDTLNYYDQLEAEGINYLFEAKVLILGESGAGKTTFARKIQNSEAPMPKDEETTKGIDIHQWTFEPTREVIQSCLKEKNANELLIENIQRRGFRANLWDFGGQEIYHGLHQFFLSHRSLYVLLADNREQRTDFNHWLHTIEQLGGNSPLVILLNRKHDYPFRIDKDGLKGRYGDFFKETYDINLGDDNWGKLQKLRKAIKHYLSELPHIGDPLPKSWVKIRNDLAHLLDVRQQKYIRQTEYMDICKKHGISDFSKMQTLSGYFHDIGVFIHYQKDKVLKNIIFLDANWTTETVYKLLNNSQIEENLGQFTKQEAQQIWAKEEEILLIDELLQLLEQFSLAYEIENTGNYIAPEHLPDEKPYQAWMFQKSLLFFSYKFDKFMPKGLMAKLIVALHDCIHNQNLVWLRGLNIEENETFAEITETYGAENRFDIKVAGKDKKELLMKVTNTFDSILKKFPKLNIDKQVPCNCEKCRTIDEIEKKTFYSYDELKERLRAGKSTIECRQLGFQDVQIAPLLNDIGILTHVETNLGIIHDSHQIEAFLKNKKDKSALRKILVLAANPKGQTRLRLQEEVRNIKRGMERAKLRDEYQVLSEGAVRINDMRRVILDHKPSFVQFSGHGSSDGELIVEDRNGKSQAIPPKALGNFFKTIHKRSPIDCVILNACYAEIQAKQIAQHIEYVIGMNNAMKDDCAIIFSEAFYDAIGAGDDIALAFEIGVNAIEMNGFEGDEEIPVIYENGILQEF